MPAEQYGLIKNREGMPVLEEEFLFMNLGLGYGAPA
jgi:hypothetical protein